MTKIKFMNGEDIPMEMHKARIVQKLHLNPVEERLQSIQGAGNNSFLLKNRDVFMDMLTDSGVNAMSDLQQAAMFRADDSYAGSETFKRLEDTIREIFGKDYYLPAHQGRACENIIAKTFITEGDLVPMNYHFTTSRAHINLNGGTVMELITEEGTRVCSDCPFKGNMDIAALEKLFEKVGQERVPFVRMEAGTNLIGGQPFSLQNLREVKGVCEKHETLLVLDASLLSDNLYFIKVREEECKDRSIREITREIASLADIIYFSARKLGCARGGGICSSNLKLRNMMRELITLYEGFLTYGGMSVREMEAMAVGLVETMDEDFVSQGPSFIEFMVREFLKNGVPVVTPAGGLGCHLNAMEFVSQVPHENYPAGALVAALYIISGIRAMKSGTMSAARNLDGNDEYSTMELVRLAVPRRVFTLSQIKFVIDRVSWLYQNREIIGGLRFTEEPKMMRGFFGRLEPIGNWKEELVRKFKEDFGDSL